MNSGVDPGFSEGGSESVVDLEGWGFIAGDAFHYSCRACPACISYIDGIRAMLHLVGNAQCIRLPFAA